MAGEIDAALRQLIAERAWQVCEYCLVHEDDLYHGCEVDHIRIPGKPALTADILRSVAEARVRRGARDR